MANEYAQRISTVVVGQIAETCGYEKAHKNALDAVADVMMRFVQELGMYAKEVVEHQGRTDVNALDMVDALAEFKYSCEDLLQFAQSEPADPFPHTLPAFPVRLEALQPPSLAASGQRHSQHIPSHLPAFPDEHTLRYTPISKARTPREAADEVATQAAAQQQSAQATLIKLHQKMHARVPEGRRNPFLEGAAGVNTATTEGGEDKRVSLMKAFEPILAAEAAAAAAEAEAHATTAKQDGVDEGADVDMMDLEGNEGEDGEPEDRWRVTSVEQEAASAPGASLYNSGRVGFALDVASQLDRSAAKLQYFAAEDDAFAADDDAPEGGPSRRRANAYSADKLKERRAQAILDLGPDAVLMEFPEGHVPRQGQ